MVITNKDGCIDCLYKTEAFKSAREGGWCYLFRHRPKVLPCKQWVIKFRNYDAY